MRQWCRTRVSQRIYRRPPNVFLRPPASLPNAVVRLQIRDELIGEVYGHAVDARLHDTLHELFRADAPSARDEAFSTKAMNQLWRHRVTSGTKLGHADRVRLRDDRVIDLSNQPARRQLGRIGTHLFEPHALERGNGHLPLHGVLAYQVCCPLRERRGLSLDLCVNMYPSLK